MLYKTYTYIVLILLCNDYCRAQLPQCSGNGSRYIYAIQDNTGGSAGSISMLDPTQPVGAGNPIINSIDDGMSSALAISLNINGNGPSPTFYGFEPQNATFQYWDGTKWVNTNHSIGSGFAVNMGAGGNYIYTFDAINGKIYKYDGTQDAQLILTIPNFKGDGPYDLIADCDGNFYILKLTSPQWFNQYSPNGTFLQQWTLTNAPVGSLGGGVALVDNKLYFDFGPLYVGEFRGNTIDVSLVYNQPNSPIPGGDYASCPLIPVQSNKGLRPDKNPAYYCGTGPATQINAIGGSGNVKWSILSGPATITGSGNSVSITATDDAKILFDYSDTTLCGIRGVDTIDFIVPKATVDAGLPITIDGCGTYSDTLNASLTGTSANINYSASWTPSNTLTIPGANKLEPIVTPTANTMYVLTISSAGLQGNCTWKDSVLVSVNDLRDTTSDFEYEIDYGCEEDVVHFTNTTTTSSGLATYIWDFDDLSSTDTNKNPIHTYSNQDIYNVSLVVDNGYCKDTVSKAIDILHPLDAKFDMLDEYLCTEIPLTFDASASNITTNRPANYEWIFSDGYMDTGIVVQHTFAGVGPYKVSLIVTDFVPCSDTSTQSLQSFIQYPYIEVGPEDTVLCLKEQMYLPIGISVNAVEYEWSDGSTQPKIQVDKEGLYTVAVSNDCGTYTDSINIVTKDCSIFIPSAFSPNNDGINDKFYFQTKYPEEISNFTMSVYNRKGNQVFTTNNITDGWDGTYNNMPQDIGTYYYMVIYEYEGENKMSKGDVTLLR